MEQSDVLRPEVQTMIFKWYRDRRMVIFASTLLALALFVLLSILTYDRLEEPTISQHVAINNVMGIAGVYISHFLVKYTIGYSAVIFPLFGLVWGAVILLKRSSFALVRLTVYVFALALITSIAVGLPQARMVLDGRGDFTPSGMIGGVAAKVMHDFLGPVGAAVALLVAYFLVVSGYLRWDVREYGSGLARRAEVRFAEWRERRRKGKTTITSHAYIKGTGQKKSRVAERKKAAVSPEATAPAVAPAGTDPSIPIEDEKQVHERGVDEMEERQTRWRQYKFPPVELLTDAPEGGEALTREFLMAQANDLEHALTTFKVQGKVVRIAPGPVITLFEVEPGEGVRVNRFTVLADDLARILSAERIRVIAPISGTKHVGVEIPNRKPAMVYLRSIINSDEYVRSKSPLSIALGKTTDGEAYCFDLASLPHLLIAGTTGSGKSVAINTIITSLLYRAKPEEVKFILIDPKKLELSSYKSLAGYHLITTPGIGEYVLTSPQNAVAALQAALREMERRYTVFTEAGVRNIAEFWALSERDKSVEKVPYIVVIIDELADLMITSGKDVEEPITRLAQMARAVGIHLVIATQRPSVDVITGLIKANFPARIAFQVATKVDSRTILDQMGAEKLLGRGDLLFLPPGTSEPIRLHAAYISLKETEAILRWVTDQPRPDEMFLPDEPKSNVPGEMGDGSSDELFLEAAKLVISHKQASVSMLQRRFRIGYSRAGRLIDELEWAGIISGYSGSKAREILVDESYLDDLEDRSL